jgi:tRNA(Ile)-lysidine synthase
VGRFDVKKISRGTKKSVEMCARDLRYAFLKRIGEENRFDRIATAHTRDDNAETILLNLVRGTGIFGLRGIPPVRGKIIRPLLSVTREGGSGTFAWRGRAFVHRRSNLRTFICENRIRLW